MRSQPLQKAADRASRAMHRWNQLPTGRRHNHSSSDCRSMQAVCRNAISMTARADLRITLFFNHVPDDGTLYDAKYPAMIAGRKMQLKWETEYHVPNAADLLRSGATG